jgi:hypothetical protein
MRFFSRTGADSFLFGTFAMIRSSSSSALRFCPAFVAPLVPADTLGAEALPSGCCATFVLVVGLIAEAGEGECPPPASCASKELRNCTVSV